MTDLATVARRALPLIDLTSLNDDDTPERIAALCSRAVTPFGKVAAVCIYPRFVAQAHKLLRNTGVRIATVVNFPHATESPRDVAAEVEAAVKAGADEIDVVAGWAQYWAAERPRFAAHLVIRAAREACGAKTLKVILETGLLRDKAAVMKAALITIREGADFIKTSTGKITPGSTVEAAEAMLLAIRGRYEDYAEVLITGGRADEASELVRAMRAGPVHRSGDRPIGFKAAGGIRTAAQAAVYLDLADRLMGPDYARPEAFRFGASGLLDDLLAILGETATAGKAAGKSDY